MRGSVVWVLLQTNRSSVQFLVRAHASVVVHIQSIATYRVPFQLAYAHLRPLDLAARLCFWVPAISQKSACHFLFSLARYSFGCLLVADPKREVSRKLELFFKNIYLFIFKERGQEGERERNSGV